MDKKEAIKAYKQTVQPMGIYQIRNSMSGKLFIGSATNLQGRINRHKFQLEMNSHPNKELQKDFNDQGADAFAFEIVDHLKPTDEAQRDYREELQMLEQLWLEKLQPFGDKGYNTQA